MDFKLNFLGVTVANFEESYRFYAETLGIEVKHFKPGWAAFQTTGMKFELFSGGPPAPPDRSWGHGQAIRPSFQIANLKKIVDYLKNKGVAFIGDINKASWGEYIEFIAPDKIHWILAHSPHSASSVSLQRPYIGGVEIKAHNHKEQQTFYTNLMGPPKSGLGKTGIIFRKADDEPLLVLESGGQLQSPIRSWVQAPLFISFETANIQKAHDWLKLHGASVLEDIAEHRWGRDFFIADADGNPIQIVQYV